MRTPAGVTWELLIVDNNSIDDTPAVAESFAKHLPIRYHFEPHQGKGFAYNRGIENAAGKLLFFTDDDVTVDEAWFEAMWAAAEHHPEVGFFGGKVIPIWEVARPAWFDMESIPELKNVIVCVELAEGTVFAIGGSLPVGANMGFRRCVFENVGRFRLDLGPNGRAGLLWDESDVCIRCLRRGIGGQYVPRAVVYHPVTPERCTKRYFWQYRVREGRSSVRVYGIPESHHRVLGIPGWMTRVLLQQFLQLARATLTRKKTEQLRHVSDFGFYLGQILEIRRLRAREESTEVR
jgi:glucosyl-dolichyl phosphate glucuronosyltransferase